MPLLLPESCSKEVEDQDRSYSSELKKKESAPENRKKEKTMQTNDN